MVDPVASKTYRYPEPDSPGSLTIGVAVIDGRLQPVRITIEGAPIVTGDLRRVVPWAHFVDLFITELNHRWGPLITASGGDPEIASALAKPGPRRGRPPLYPEGHWQAVAGVYSEAADRPVVAVADHFMVAPSTARKWVERARRLGYLA